MINTDLLQEIPSNYSLANGENKKDEVLAMCPAFGPRFRLDNEISPTRKFVKRDSLHS